MLQWQTLRLDSSLASFPQKTYVNVLHHFRVGQRGFVTFRGLVRRKIKGLFLPSSSWAILVSVMPVFIDTQVGGSIILRSNLNVSISLVYCKSMLEKSTSLLKTDCLGSNALVADPVPYSILFLVAGPLFMCWQSKGGFFFGLNVPNSGRSPDFLGDLLATGLQGRIFDPKNERLAHR